MPPTFALPLAIVLAAASAASLAHGRLRPAAGTRVAALACLTSAAAWIGVLVALVAGSAAGLVQAAAPDASLAQLLWCPPISFPPGVATLTSAAVGSALLAWSAIRVVRRVRSTVADHRRLPRCGREGLLVLDTEEPSAFAVPGRDGGVVVTRGLMRVLDERERAVVRAHEQAHLRNHHHRYLVVADLSAAAAPFLRPLASRVRFGTERWADEESARRVGDRRLVARTIAKAALAGVDHRPAGAAMAVATSSVPARVEALLDHDRAELGTIAGTALAVATTSVGVAASATQLHHLATLAAHLCGTGH